MVCLYRHVSSALLYARLLRGTFPHRAGQIASDRRSRTIARLSRAVIMASFVHDSSNGPSHKTVHDGCSPSQYIDPPGSLWSLENSAFWRSRPRVLKERSRTIANTTISGGSCMTDDDEGTPSLSSAAPVPSISPEQSGIIRFGGFPTMKRSAPSPSSGSSRKGTGA